MNFLLPPPWLPVSAPALVPSLTPISLMAEELEDSRMRTLRAAWLLAPQLPRSRGHHPTPLLELVSESLGTLRENLDTALCSIGKKQSPAATQGVLGPGHGAQDCGPRN